MAERTSISEVSTPESISIPAIKKIMPRMREIVTKCHEAFQNGDYTLLICDDLSGRIPALILEGVINYFNEQKGRPKIPITFVKCQREPLELTDQDKQRLQESLAETRSEGKKALIVTESIVSGHHIKSISKEVKKAEVRFDIATVSRVHFASYYRIRNLIPRGTRIFPSFTPKNILPQLKIPTSLRKVKAVEDSGQIVPLVSKDVDTAVRQLIAQV